MLKTNFTKITVGKAVIIKEKETQKYQKKNRDYIREEKKFFDVLKKVKKEIDIKIKDESKSKEEKDLLKSSQFILCDENLVEEVVLKIKEGKSLYISVEEVFDKYISAFSDLEDEYFSERANDLYDLKKYLLEKINYKKEKIKTNEEFIAIANNLGISFFDKVELSKLRGIIVERGTYNSHLCILARSYNIPILIKKDALNIIKDGEYIGIDEENKEILLNLSLEDFLKVKEVKAKTQKKLKKEVFTKDNKRVNILANIEDIKILDFKYIEEIEGIGLFRSEYLLKEKILSEDEQFKIYAKLVEVFKNKELTIRTFDIGGDKIFSCLNVDEEECDFLGLRGIRLGLNKLKDLYKTQLKALFRASVYGKIRILFPFVSIFEEIEELKCLIKEIRLELNDAFEEKNIKLGIMIETPTALILADKLAKEVDFFSIGTNDLLQYISATKRTNSSVSYLYSDYNLGFLRSLIYLKEILKNIDIEISVCGDIVLNKHIFFFLMSLGIKKYSVSPYQISKIQGYVEDYSEDKYKEIVEKVRTFSKEEEVKTYLTSIC